MVVFDYEANMTNQGFKCQSGLNKVSSKPKRMFTRVLIIFVKYFSVDKLGKLILLSY